MNTKRILVLSLGPIFKNHIHGGSQKILKEVITYLGSKGHKISVYCTKRDDNYESFQLTKNVTVHPILRFKQTFPLPYLTAPFNLARIIELIEKEKKNNDVIYAHDSGFNFPFLFDKIPTVSSLRDFYYPETLIGAFSFDRDEVIVNSQYTFDCLTKNISGLRPGIKSRVAYIPNGIDINHFYKRNSLSEVKKIIKIKQDDIPILYPHRPEISKGIFEVLKVVALIKEKGISNLKLLIPKYIDLIISNEHQPIYDKILTEAKNLDLTNNIIFHPWIPYNLLPEYYSLGKLSLSIGNFVESFPNVSLESIACGTPSISARVAAHRTVLPEKIEPKVDFGDYVEAANLAYNYITCNYDNEILLQGRNYIEKHYQYNHMLKEYEKIITNCRLKEPIKIRINSKKITHVTLPPWTYLSQKYGLYNDYKYAYINDKSLFNKLSDSKKIKISSENEAIFKYHIEEGNLIGIKNAE